MATHSSILKNSMDRGAWQATVHKVAKSQTCLSDRLSLSRNNQPSSNDPDSHLIPKGRILLFVIWMIWDGK